MKGTLLKIVYVFVVITVLSIVHLIILCLRNLSYHVINLKYAYVSKKRGIIKYKTNYNVK